MATYNFAKSKKKNLNDTHTEMRLKEQHTKAPNAITEKQLDEKDHEGEFEVTTEKQLEKLRCGGADAIIEKKLDDSKGMFGSKFRNPEAYQGDINKLEEKRLSGHKTEDEKYSPASETQKPLRWWESLKKAGSDSVVKTAQDMSFDPADRFNRLKETPGLDPDDEGVILEDDIIPDLGEQAEDIEEKNFGKEVKEEKAGRMFVTKNKEGDSPIPHIFMELNFDPNLFKNDDAAKAAALEKVLELRPNLEGKIDVDDFSDPEYGIFDASVKLRLVGDEYFAPAEDIEGGGSPVLSIESEDVDVGGTDMTVGRVILSPQAEAMDTESLMQAITDYITDQTGLEVPETSIQINLEKNEATFAYDPEGALGKAVTPEETPEAEDEIIGGFEIPEEEEEELEGMEILGETNFPVIIADTKKN